jgi:mannose-6-phosphate isomerase-like protein (cupin superfamily)
MSAGTLKPLTVGPGEGRVYDHLAGEKMTILLSAQDTDGAFAMFIDEVPPAAGPPLHIHHNEDETFYVLEGELAMQVNDEKFTAPVGTAVFLPKGIPHTFHNFGTQTARALVTVTPGGLEGFFTEVEPLTTQSEPDMAAILAMAGQYGIEAILPGQSNDNTGKHTSSLSPQVVRPGQATSYGVPGGETITVLLTGEQTGGQFALLHGEFGPGDGAPLHLHHREDETFYILEGALDMQVGQTKETAIAGATVFRPREIPHDFFNNSDRPATAVALVAPAGFENYFADFYGLLAQGEPDMQAVLSVAQKYGMEINLQTGV